MTNIGEAHKIWGLSKLGVLIGGWVSGRDHFEVSCQNLQGLGIVIMNIGGV